jgi:hypothetical protein
MSEISQSPPVEVSRFALLQQRISIFTWFITLLLSLRGLYDFYGMKSKGSFEQGIHFVTEPVVQLFRFDAIENLNIPAIGVFFAAITILIASYSMQMFLRYSQSRYAKVRNTLVQQAISTSVK